MDFNYNRRYFEEKSKVPLYTGIGLGVFGLLLFTGGEVGVILGLMFIAGGAAVFYFFDYKRRIEDSEIDQICANQVVDLRDVALDKLGVDEDEVSEAGHLQISGYDVQSKTVGVLYKLGNDKVWRSTQYEIVVFFFSKEAVHCFVRKFSIISNEQFDTIEEFFYRDIVSVKVIQNDQGVHSGGNYIELTTTAGTVFKYDFKKTDSEKVNRSINAMRNLIKEKRQTMA